MTEKAERIERFLLKVIKPKGDKTISIFGFVYIWKDGAYMGYHTK